MVSEQLTVADAWKALSEVFDPEIPVLSVVDMKIIRGVCVNGSSVVVEITPTFSGCPALDQIQSDIRSKLVGRGFSPVEVRKNLTNAWSSDMLDDSARERLRSFGIAPPAPVRDDLSEALAEPVRCPYCASMSTRLDSPYGPTLCKQIYYCDSCRQSFERFKTL